MAGVGFQLLRGKRIITATGWYFARHYTMLARCAIYRWPSTSAQLSDLLRTDYVNCFGHIAHSTPSRHLITIPRKFIYN